MRPWGNEGGESIAPCRVGVSVRRNVDPLGTRGFNFRDSLRHVSPGWLARNFEMPNLNRDVGFAGDANYFIERLQDSGAFAALMRGLQETSACGRPCASATPGASSITAIIAQRHLI